jgi:tRNA(Ile)-lysidine synthase
VIADSDRPLDAALFAGLMAPFEPFEREPILAVAVSGGRDSVALALLAHDWARARDGRVVALIVDHGLRPEAAEEAARTLALIDAQGGEGIVLRWTGTKPTAGLQEAARAARYRLLGEECRRRGILHLLVAHHADDQAETVAMRAARDSGPDGLAGMAAQLEQEDLRLLRPLLGIGRSRLTATLRARDVRWVDDPSNADPRFERARLRAAGCPVLVPPPAGPARPARERVLADAAVAVLDVPEPGALAIDRAAFLRLEFEQQAGLLSRVVQSIGGGEHPPRRERLARAVGRLAAPVARGKSGKSQDFTLSECEVLLRQERDGRRLLWIVRPERGRKDGKRGAQPLIPAVFFACGASLASHLSHLERTPSPLEQAREPLQP